MCDNKATCVCVCGALLPLPVDTLGLAKLFFFPSHTRAASFMVTKREANTSALVDRPRVFDEADAQIEIRRHFAHTAARHLAACLYKTSKPYAEQERRLSDGQSRPVRRIQYATGDR